MTEQSEYVRHGAVICVAADAKCGEDDPAEESSKIEKKMRAKTIGWGRGGEAIKEIRLCWYGVFVVPWASHVGDGLLIRSPNPRIIQCSLFARCAATIGALADAWDGMHDG
jgi:hypothetical protein